MKKEKSTIINKIMTVIGTMLCIVLIPILIINCTLIVKSYINKDEVPSFGSRFPMIVLTDSMYPEIKTGDMIICQQTEAEKIQIGDIICFFDPSGNGSTTVTHRVTQITIDEEGELSWITKGDANNVEDDKAVPSKNLVGIYKMRIAGAGNVAMFMQTTQGLIICVICPIILLIGYDMIRRRMYEKQKKEDTEALLAELEALRAEKQNSQNNDSI